MKSVAVSIFLLPDGLMAQEASSSSTHTHQVGRLEMSVLGNEITLALKVPGTDIVGFEHPTYNDEDRSRVADAISDLSKPLTIFEIPPEAGCMTASANVALVGDAFGQEEPSGDGADHH